MTDYPFSSIFINNREVELEEIVSGAEKARSDFEESTFSFIRSWLSGEMEFRQNTSGSTGLPKTISLHREQLITSANLTEEALQLRKGFHALVCLDTRYIAGKMMLVRSFVTGMRIIAVSPSANPLADVDSNQKIDFASFVPYQVQEIISSDKAFRLNAIQTAIIGGAALDLVTKDGLQLFSCQFYATYGMTETVSHVALQKLNGKDASDFFHTLPGVEIKSDDRNCLIIKSPVIQDVIHTNDIVELASEHTFRWVGRHDNVINSGGFKISPEILELEIEKFFQKAEIDRPFFITGLPDEKLGTRMVLVIEGERLKGELIEKIKLMFKHSFKAYEIPKEILAVKSFFLTDTGKINRPKTIELIEK
jgi:o-succinylbenzoate---CoA ligase